MGLLDKYAKLIDFAKCSGVKNLSVTEQANNVLLISGAATVSVKDEMWSIYEHIDPDMKSNDLVMSIDVLPGGQEVYEVMSGDSLSKIATKFPGMTWQKIFEANKGLIKDPNLIYPGQKIIIPL